MVEKFLINISPRDYQRKIYESCIEKNCLVVLPTGVGKTLIALMLAIKRIELYPNEKVVFLAPTKPLAEQHENYFKKHLPPLFGDIQLFTGEINPQNRKKIWQTANIIFSTPQCVANDVRNGLYYLSEVSLLIEDEAHRCLKNYDYNFVSSKYQEQAKHKRILGLTASPGSETKKIMEICKNLSIEKLELRDRESTDVKKYLQELEFEKLIVEFPKELEEIRHVLKKIFDGYIEELKLRKVLFEPPTKTNLIMLQKKISAAISRGNNNFNYMLAASACAQTIKLQYALELLETQTLDSLDKYLKNLQKQAQDKKSKGIVKLVEKPEFNFVTNQVNELLAKNFEHPKVQTIKNLIEKELKENIKVKVIVFTQYRDTATMISKNLNKIVGIKSKVFLGQTKKGESRLSQKQQKEIIREFGDGIINVICATSIGEEGLDIPEVNTVIFYEPVPSAIRAIQRAGRTARLMKGKLIIMVTKGTRDETFYYVSRAKEKKMKKSIEAIQKNFENKEIGRQKTLI